MEKIDNPKVFISYAWGTEEYKEKVLSFARDLIGCGVDVELDRWSLKEGFDSYAFMEQSVNDPTITNVIILLDPVYAKKADARTGGVGTETQIISPEIYNNTKQEKFIPVVFERDENGAILKPSFLRGLLHFDLSIEETYNSEFERLVKRLFGREAIKKPEIGTRPAWVDQETSIHTKTRVSFDILKGNQPDRVKRERFFVFLSNLKSQINEYTVDSHGPDELLYHYEKLQEIRDQFLLLIKYYIYIDDSVKSIGSFFEDTKAALNNSKDVLSELKELLINEMFIYTVAYLYKAKDYHALSELLCKTYFIGTYGKDNGQSFEIFRVNNELFDIAVRDQADKKYYSGIANWWIEHLNTEICTKAEFVFADLLCFNASVLIDNTEDYYWFPICYVYDEGEHKSIRIFANKLRSKENLTEVSTIFGFADGEAFRTKLKELEAPERQNAIRAYRYRERFEPAPYIGYCIKASELGTKR